MTTALADGSYLLGDLAPGTHDLEFSFQGYSTRRLSLQVPEKGEVKVDVVLQETIGEGKIGGTVIDSETSRPMREGKVILVLPIANKYAPISGDGHYEFSAVPPGTYKLFASVPGYEEQEAEVIVSNNEQIMRDLRCKRVKTEEPPWG